MYVSRLLSQHYCMAQNYGHFTACDTDKEIGSCSLTSFSDDCWWSHEKTKKVRNEDIRKKTGLWKLEHMIKERRRRWLGHVLKMEDLEYPGGNWETTRESWDSQEKSGWTSSDEIGRIWTLAGKKRKNWRQMEQNGVKGMRVELSSEVEFG